MTRVVTVFWVLGAVVLAGCGSDGGGIGTDSGTGPGVDSGTVPDPTIKRRLGFPCTEGSDCASSYCVDGVCCDGLCDGVCEACDPVLTGATGGLCSPEIACSAGCMTDDDCTDPRALCDNSECVVGKLVFVSAADIGIADFGGVSGADTICQADADAQGLPGTYRAWLSTSTSAAADRFTHAAVPYLLTNKAVVANDWDDLVDGTLVNPIDHYADGTKVGAGGSRPVITGVWTGTGVSGVQAGPNCLDWSSSTRQQMGTIGRTYDTDSGWTDFNRSAACDNVFNRRIYCFEQ